MKKFIILVCLSLIAFLCCSCVPKNSSSVEPDKGVMDEAAEPPFESLEFDPPYEGGFVPTIDFGDKTYTAYGDSITWGFWGGERMEKPYPTVVSEMLGLRSYLNLGQNGATLCVNDQGLFNMTERILSRPYYADIVSVLMGVNDWARALPLGAVGDVDNTTVYGSLYLIMEHFTTYYADSFVFFMTPLKVDFGETNSYTANSQGYDLEAVANAIKEMAKKYDYPVLDLFTYGCFEVEMSKQESDGIHPSQWFVEKYTAPQIARFINDNYK